MTRYVSLAVFSVLFCIACKAKEDGSGVPDGKSVGETSSQSDLRLPYLLAHVISQQLSEYKVCVEERTGVVGDRTLSSIESDLQLNLLRALYLAQEKGLSPGGKFQLDEAHKRSVVYFQRNPTRNFFASHGATSDFGRDEPVLPRYYPAKSTLQSAYPASCFR